MFLIKSITERKLADEQFKALVDALPVSVAVIDTNLKIMLNNQRWSAELGDSSRSASKDLPDYLSEPEACGDLDAVLSDKRTIIAKHRNFVTDAGRLIDCLFSAIPVHFRGAESILAVVVDISERVKMEQDLARAKEAAEQASRFKSEFLANMSHEIRTPMNAIIGFADLLANRVTEPSLLSFVKTIQSASHGLLQLINDVLDLSKIEAGKMEIHKAPCNVHELFNDLGNVFAANIGGKNFEFAPDIDPRIPSRLLLDTVRLRQVLFNLIGSAVKFTDRGYIRLVARTENEDEVKSKLDLVIAVEDSGIGIPQEQLQKIFEAFGQVHSQRHEKYGGTGLGLTISQRLTRMMGGAIEVSSRLGVGSVLTLHLRAVDVANVEESPALSRAPDSGYDIRFHPAMILAADDVPDNLRLLKEIFAGTLVGVIGAGNGREAVEQARLHRPDLILMDLRMPVMDGYEASIRIKSFLDAPIVALTASVLREEIEQAKNSIFDSYLCKPIARLALMKELSRFLPHEVRPAEPDEKLEFLSLSGSAARDLPDILESLSRQAALWEAVSKNNNISDIRVFSKNILEIAEKYSCKPLLDYAGQLEASLDTFEILEISRLLKQYPALRRGLSSHLPARSA